MKDKPSGPEATLAILFMLAMIVPSVMWRGYVLSIMWGWFLVPTFDLPLLKIAPALGISAIFGFMSPSCKKEDDDSDSIGQIVLKSVVKAFAIPAWFLLFGWIVKHWM